MSDVDHTAIPIQFDPTVQRMVGRAVHGNTRFDVPFISQIDGNLWQGGCQHGLVLPSFIKHVVSLYKWERYTINHEIDSFMEVRMYDSTDGVDLEQVIDIANWVNSCADRGPVLIHCQAGLNRSSLIAGTALVMSGAYRPEQAVTKLRSQRSNACLCNPEFEHALLSLTEYLA